MPLTRKSKRGRAELYKGKKEGKPNEVKGRKGVLGLQGDPSYHHRHRSPRRPHSRR